MAEPFIGEIRMFAGNFAPRGWAFCSGQLLPISQNTALFSLLGTTYGGDGRTTLALPDLRGRAPMHPGTGPGLAPRTLGKPLGEVSVTLREGEMPEHRHQFVARSGRSNQPGPVGNTLARTPSNYAESGADVSFPDDILAGAGGGQAHPNMQPYLVLNFIIALVGVYPPRE